MVVPSRDLKLACSHFYTLEPESPRSTSILHSSSPKSLPVLFLLHLEPVFPEDNSGASCVSLEVVPWVTESKASCRRGQGSGSSWEVVLGAPCPALPPRLLLVSAAKTATADGSTSRTPSSEVPALTWSLELLRRWEVRDTRSSSL